MSNRDDALRILGQLGGGRDLTLMTATICAILSVSDAVDNLADVIREQKNYTYVVGGGMSDEELEQYVARVLRDMNNELAETDECKDA